MADETKDSKKDSKADSQAKRISVDQRMHYIGFDVFPGKPKDLFKTADEQKHFVDGVLRKRESGEKLREECTLLEERVNWRDRLVMTVASIVVVAALFLPWYSVYNEIVEEAPVSTGNTGMSDSTAMMGAMGDSLGGAMMDSASMAAVAGQAVDSAAQAAAAVAAQTQAQAPAQPERNVHSIEGDRAGEELITAYKAKKKIRREYESATGLGGVLLLGSAGSYVFGSGIILILTAIVFLVYTLLCLALPAYTLYGIYGMKGDEDEKALKLKKVLRYNWIPLILFVLATALSFVGAGYGFNAEQYFTSLDSSYSVAVFLGSLSWGVFVSMAAFVLLAAKGIEI